MNLKRTALVLILGAASLGAMSATANAQPVREPARYEAVAHVDRQRHEIRQEVRRGEHAMVGGGARSARCRPTACSPPTIASPVTRGCTADT
jgi:hypothetical protein